MRLRTVSDLHRGASFPIAVEAVIAPAGSGLSDLVRRAVVFLEKSYINPVKLRDIEAVTTSKQCQLIRAFRRDLGTTPHAFIVELRVRHAMSLLMEGRRIVDAAAESGFVDQSHMTRHFKRVCGTTPGKFRRRCMENVRSEVQAEPQAA